MFMLTAWHLPGWSPGLLIQMPNFCSSPKAKCRLWSAFSGRPAKHRGTVWGIRCAVCLVPIGCGQERIVKETHHGTPRKYNGRHRTAAKQECSSSIIWSGIFSYLSQLWGGRFYDKLVRRQALLPHSFSGSLVHSTYLLKSHHICTWFMA